MEQTMYEKNMEIKKVEENFRTVSKYRGVPYKVADILHKFLDRASFEYSFDTQLISDGSPNHNDEDRLLKFQISCSSQWGNESPKVRISGSIPYHITGSGDLRLNEHFRENHPDGGFMYPELLLWIFSDAHTIGDSKEVTFSNPAWGEETFMLEKILTKMILKNGLMPKIG